VAFQAETAAGTRSEHYKQSEGSFLLPKTARNGPQVPMVSGQWSVVSGGGQLAQCCLLEQQRLARGEHEANFEEQ